MPHFINKDLYLGKRVLEVGTASLRNFLQLIIEWFQLDLSNYNFFLMPISFYHGFEAAKPASLAKYPEQVKHFIEYLDGLEKEGDEHTEPCRQAVALRWKRNSCVPKMPRLLSSSIPTIPRHPALLLSRKICLRTIRGRTRNCATR